MAELLIYTPKITPRINYIFQLFFDSLIKTQFAISADEAAFRAYDGPKLNYSATAFPGDKLQIVPYGLLTETGIKPEAISVTDWNNLKIFFEMGEGSIPFDIFSASFYLVSRYEEYLSHKPDEHNRFHHANSLAFKYHFLNEPLVNYWAEELKKIILSQYPSVSFSENTYSFVPTVDIDVAYAYLARNLPVAIGSLLKTLFQFHFKTLAQKIKVLLHLKKDPYDTYDYQQIMFEKYKLHPIYFILAGKRSDHDKNISPENISFKMLVKKLSSYADIGVHPSYHSENEEKIIAEEIKNIQSNDPGKIFRSRQHFLKTVLPETYRCLARLGITDDYTMAYAGVTGFRASICSPFLFYDLPAESALPVRVHSCALMDGTLNEYLHLPVPDAITISKELINKVKKCKGEFIFIWHNHSLDEQDYWEGWRMVFETIMEAGTQ